MVKAAQKAEEKRPRPVKRDPATYNLPAMVAAAVATNRKQLCDAYAASIMAAGTGADNVEMPATELGKVADMARLIGDLLEDRQHMLIQLHSLNTSLKNVRNQIAAFHIAVQEAIGDAHGVDAEDDDCDGEEVHPVYTGPNLA